MSHVVKYVISFFMCQVTDCCSFVVPSRISGMFFETTLLHRFIFQESLISTVALLVKLIGLALENELNSW